MNGIELRPELLIVCPPGTEGEVVVEIGYSSVSLLISPDDFFDHLIARGCRDEFHMPSRVNFLKIKELGTRPVFNLGKRLCQLAKRQPNLFEDNESVRISAHAEILETLLATLGQKSRFSMTQGDRRRQNYSQMIQTVEAHLLSDPANRFHVSDLCNLTGVNERTLQHAFSEVLGTSPMAYMKLMRIHRLRSELVAASKRKATVSAVVLDWGFWNFGEFTQAYKQCFQELPSETLKGPSVKSSG